MQTSKFINTGLKSDSDSESSDLDSESSDSDLDSDSESSDLDSDSDLGNLCFSSSVNYSYILKYIFLREQFKYTLSFWLLISLATALYFHGC